MKWYYNMDRVFRINEEDPYKGNLYLGSAASARDMEQVYKNGVKAILSITEEK